MQKQVSESELRLLVGALGRCDFEAHKAGNGWRLLVRYADQNAEVRKSKGGPRIWKTLCALAAFIEEVAPSTKTFVVVLANEGLP